MVPAVNPEVKFTRIFVYNEWRNSGGGKTFPVLNPATGERICEVESSEEEDVDLAVRAAKQAFELDSRWRTMDASTRGIMMHRLANLMEKNLEYLASLESLNSGIIYKDSQMHVKNSVKVVRYYAAWTDKIHGNTVPADGNYFVYTRTEPSGVCALILSWTLPLFNLVSKLAPALAAGCCAVVKPAAQTPLTALFMASLVEEAGFPPGVVNVLPGYGNAGAMLCKHLGVDKVSFSGTPEVAKLVQETSGMSNSKRVTLEVAGKNPMVVMPDCDLDFTVNFAHIASFYNQGELFNSGSCIFVHKDIYNEFVRRSRRLVMARTVGDPFDDKSLQGPQIDEAHLNHILEMIESAKEDGATLECGGDRWGIGGYFIQATLLSNMKSKMKIASELVLGPIQMIFRFEALEDVIEAINTSVYGMAAGIFTNNMNNVMTFSQNVRVGSIWVNCWFATSPQTPAGGMGTAGSGREMGEDGLLPYLETKTIAIAITEKNS